jgi:hypothetical protein
MSGQHAYMRIWQTVDVEAVKKHLLIVGELTGDCASCRELGIPYASAKNCPQCGTDFHFVTARSAVGSAKTSGGVVKRIKDKRPDLTFIDHDDYIALTGKQSARDFFGV